jgi:hypothetical protein
MSPTDVQAPRESESADEFDARDLSPEETMRRIYAQEGLEPPVWDARRGFPNPKPVMGYYNSVWEPPSAEERASPLKIVGLDQLISRHMQNCPSEAESQVSLFVHASPFSSLTLSLPVWPHSLPFLHLRGTCSAPMLAPTGPTRACSGTA